jgi:hypothetical protein
MTARLRYTPNANDLSSIVPRLCGGVVLLIRRFLTMQLSSRKWISTGMALATKGMGFALLLSAISASAFATPTSPEMDPGLATGAMALLSSGLLLIAGRRRRSK